MNSKPLKTFKSKDEKNSFLSLNQQPLNELLTFIDFADNKLNIAFVEIKFPQDREILINFLVEDPECKDVQFAILDFPSPNLRFLRDELLTELQKIKIEPNKKLILFVTGLEKSIGIVEEYPAVLTNLNFVRDDLRTSVPHPILFFLPKYALTRLAKYAPDLWSWGRKVFTFQTNRENLVTDNQTLVRLSDDVVNFELSKKHSRIEILLQTLSEYNSLNKEEKQNSLATISNIYYELGRVYDHLSGYKKAINYFQQSLEIAQKIKDRDSEAKSLNNLGNVYNSLGKYQQAIDYNQQSLEIARKIGDRNGAANTWYNLGNTYNDLQQQAEAKTAYENARDLYRELGLDKKVEDCNEAILNTEKAEH